ncbi:hypothetical protein CCAX7_35890 [Capsulimonas corticalis]|uniref:Uncharacterized protein n=1 Tax=Capsulimonas corticalis TaxID=2219043 RepID=A0A402D607_9BACT|nr:YsnF/AvaK domain-containing protein [Capsulimonas corticalis]BDI31538.1 hypothetical protein CCAX7_35890 [Capsulimonas corticalis]
MSEDDLRDTLVNDENRIVVPIVEETVDVRKRIVETGKVRIAKTVTEREEVVDIPFLRTEVEVRHVLIDRFVDAAPPIRHEGDVMIIPVMEEVLVVEKRLKLKEEIHIAQHRTEFHDTQTVLLRREVVSENRVVSGDDGEQSTSSS